MNVVNLSSFLLAIGFGLPDAYSAVEAITTYPCPPAGSSSPLSDILPTTATPTTIRLPIISASDGLCLLLRNDPITGKSRAPVARSYAGRLWEQSAGLFARTGSGVTVDCSAGTANECDVTLPPLDPSGSEQYVLESYEHGITGEAEAARFLEQATFGSTRESIDAMNSTSNDFASWVEEQLALPISSHREFYRKRTNPKYEFPYAVGATGPRPCELHSRWRRYALTSRDQLSNRKTSLSKHLMVELVNGKYVWKVDGHFRTVTTDPPAFTDSGYNMVLGVRYRILWDIGNTWKSDCVGCPIKIKYDGKTKILLNPEVSVESIEGDTSILPYNVVNLPHYKSTDFPSIEDSNDYPLFDTWIKPHENGLLNSTSLEISPTQCDDFPTFRQPFPYNEAGSPPGAFPAVFGRSTDVDTGLEVVFAYDPHLALYENTVENPLLDGGGQLVMDTQDIVAGTQVECQNVKRSFLNEDGCKLSYLPNACAPGKKPKKVIVLDGSTLSGINGDTGMLLYAATGLPITADVDSEGNPYLKSPCATSTSRWVKDETDTVCANTANLGPETIKTFSYLISSKDTTNNDFNPSVVDVKRSKHSCDEADISKLDMGRIQAGDGSCWVHRHPSDLNVVDLTGADPAQYTLSGVYASFSSMDYFYNTVENSVTPFPVVGKLGDHVALDGSEPSPLDTQAIQDTYKTLDYNPALGPVLVCGSPNEVASDPFYGDHGFDVVTAEGTGYRSWSIWEFSAQRHTTWAHLALHADDQLRQKMAWSLSQIVAVGLPGSGMVFNEETEHYIAFYDTFVNHAFGDYLTLMKEFSFNNIMGGWLSHKGNKSFQYNKELEGKEVYPDENFAREIMQLFSIGLYEMNMDGTNVIDDISGRPKETYDIDDIMSYARAWTGLDSPDKRGGVSVAERQWTDKVIDPMRIVNSYRDKFPKTDLIGGYIGDRVPLCEDLPGKHFLRKGATYHALGTKPIPEMQYDSDDWADSPDFLRLQVLPSSPLYAKLCAEDAKGDCTLPSKVVLDENLFYDAAAMTGAEYAVDTIRTVQLSVGLSNPVYYEYIRQPCVETAFYNNAKKVIKGQIWSDKIIEPSLCGNPKLEVAAAMCMSNPESGTGKIACRYQGERMTYASAEAMCAEYQTGWGLGHPGSVKEPRANTVCSDGLKNALFRSWSNAWCTVKVKIDLATGYIAIVNEVEPDYSVNATAQVEELVSPDTMNFFKTVWDNEVYPASNDCLALPACSVHGNGYCICDTDVSESQVFTSTNEVTSIDQLMSLLHVGAVDPSTFDSGTYTDLGGCGIAGVNVYTKLGDCSMLSTNTIFAFEWKSKQHFLKNSKSTVHILDTAYSFRNPVHFINFADPEVRDMYHETDSVLESLFYHHVHPPNMAYHLIQRFGVSNPSPTFIERVATAYKLGSYDNGRFGSGKYGDLAALVAAILLDDETREAVLDADPSHGHVREPLIKVLSFFRGMRVRFASPLHIPTLLSSESKIGQGSFESPSVFGFFLPEFTPSVEAVQSAGLVAPESMVLAGENVLDLHEIMFSTVKFGVTQCYSPSLEGWRVGQPFSCASNEGDTSLSPASPEFWPASTSSVDDILDELQVLLTSGRLTAKNRAIIKSIVEPEFNVGNMAKAVRMAEQLVFACPEFHTTGSTRNLNELRQISGYTEAPIAPYKAVVVLFMTGGADSFNLLVPVSGCSAGIDQYEEYVTARGALHSLPLTNLTTISAATSGQSCDTFGVNNKFSYLAQLYNEGDALFLANTGLLSKHLTKYDDWNDETSFQLFAHNTMIHEYMRGDPYKKNPNTGVFGRILDKLKLQGFQTSANTAGTGGTMLTGSSDYQNPIFGVSTSAPKPLNQDPTVENIYGVVKELNGLGEPDSSVMSETWSSRVATSLFEQEQMELIANTPGFDVTNYGGDDGMGGEGSLGGRFKAILEYMKSRAFRKVNREVFIMQQKGYDHHSSNSVSDLFKTANNAIEDFVFELKNHDLWDNTVLIMGSDFGRSLNPNSNDGTDHAWGGNYFMAGGKVKGGQIVGQYPQPLSPDHPKWIGRGRFIPTTPWDAVWNGIGNWLGLQDDVDLDWALPNRESFDKCNDLLFDTDLFTDGACTCSGCVDVTWPPTPIPPPPPPPSPSPTRIPGVFYEGEDSNNTRFDTSIGDGNPGFYGTGYANMGGQNSYVQFNSIDGGSGGACTLSFRYANGGIAGRPCDVMVNGSPVGTLQFPVTSAWTDYQHDTIETQCAAGSNVIRITASTGEGGPNIDHLEYSSSSQVTATNPPTTRLTANPSMAPTGSPVVSTNSPTASPSKSPTQPPSTSPSKTPTSPPTPRVTDSPTMMPTGSPIQPTNNPTTKPPTSGEPVDSVLDAASAVTFFGCNVANMPNGVPQRAFDRSTEKFYCDRTGQSGPAGVEVSPFHGKVSIVESMRLYSHNNCPNCDAVDYILEGRVDSLSPWVTISQGDLPWKDAALPRNGRGQPVTSTYEAGDPNMHWTEVPFPSNNVAFLEYKISFPTTRLSTSTSFQFAEVELPGLLFDETPGTSNPTSSPSSSPTTSPVVSTNNPSANPSKAPSSSPSKMPSTSPTAHPSKAPTLSPVHPSNNPTSSPSKAPSTSPTSQPTDNPTTNQPSKSPTQSPSGSPSKQPSSSPSKQPSMTPSSSPSKTPSTNPTTSPSKSLTHPPTSSPTSHPSKAPSSRPSKMPSTSPIHPTNSPSAHPSKAPTIHPTNSPTASQPSTPTQLVGDYVNTVFSSDSVVTRVGCTDDNGNVNKRAFDVTTEKFYCTRDLTSVGSGIIVQPSHQRMSIAEKLRVYAHNNCNKCDAVSYILSGRVDANSPWEEIGSGDLPWRTYTPGRNNRGLSISSTYESADPALVSTEVSFSSNTAAYLDYKVVFPEIRDNSGAAIQAAEIELPGFLIAPSPTLSPTESPVVSLPDDGQLVNTIFGDGSTYTAFGCTNGVNDNAIDGTTGKFACYIPETGPYGIILTPGHGRLSVATSVRVYSHNNCPNCDAVAYILEGRVDSSSPWVEIGSGNFPWIDPTPGRNPRGVTINSTWESPDPNLVSTEVFFSSNGADYLEYKLTFTASRDPNASHIQLAEIELPGFVFN